MRAGFVGAGVFGVAHTISIGVATLGYGGHCFHVNRDVGANPLGVEGPGRQSVNAGRVGLPVNYQWKRRRASRQGAVLGLVQLTVYPQFNTLDL
jgi:hypothetical protein